MHLWQSTFQTYKSLSQLWLFSGWNLWLCPSSHRSSPLQLGFRPFKYYRYATNHTQLGCSHRLINEQLDYNKEQLAARVIANKAKFNDAQNGVYNAVMESVNNNNTGKTFFLHSAGGCGKTFVCNTITAAVRSQGKIALCVASSGIASLLLEGGRTAHSTFNSPSSQWHIILQNQ